MKKYYYLTIFILMLLVACESSHLPDGVLTKRKMVPILVDIHLSEAVFNQRFSIAMVRDSLPEDLYLSICKKYKIERTTLEKSLHYYGKHTGEFIPIYDQVLNVLNEMEVNAKRDSVRPVHPGGFDRDTSKIKKSSPAAKTSAEIK